MKKLIALVITTLFLATGVCSAHPSRDGAGKPQGGHPPEELPMPLMKLPDITAEQKAAISKILQAEREKQDAQIIKRAELRKQLRTVEEMTPVDEVAIRNIATALGELEAVRIASRALVRAKVNALLTPVQRARLTMPEPPPAEHPGRPGGCGCAPPPPDDFRSGPRPE